MGVGLIEELISGDPPVPEDEILGRVGLLPASGCGGDVLNSDPGTLQKIQDSKSKTNV